MWFQGKALQVAGVYARDRAMKALSQNERNRGGLYVIKNDFLERKHNMNEMIIQEETMSSLQVAEITGKQHAHIMRDIRNMVDSIKKSNESTSGLVGSEYHRGDRTQYKFLSEHTQNILLNFATGENLPQYQITETFYIDAKGEKRAMYNLNKKACLLLASGYNVVLRAKIIDRWEELELEKRSGGFLVPKSFSEALMLAANQAKQIEEQAKLIEAKDTQIKEEAPRVLFSKAVETSKRSCLIGELAKILQKNGINIGQNRLFKWLRENGYLCNKGEMYNQPTQKAMELGLFEIKQTVINKPDGSVVVKSTTKVAGKGQVYFVNKFLGGSCEGGIKYPSIEEIENLKVSIPSII